MALGYVLSRLGYWWFRARVESVPKTWTLNGWPIITQASGSRIRIGERVVLTSMSRYTALGVAHPVILRTLSPGSEIVVGADTGLSGTTICAQTSVRIGKECLIGSNVTIVDTDFHPTSSINRRFMPLSKAKSKAVVIGDNVFIGGSSMILKGVSIGGNSIVGAGSVVTTSLPPNVIAAGNPCRVIRSLDDDR